MPITNYTDLTDPSRSKGYIGDLVTGQEILEKTVFVESTELMLFGRGAFKGSMDDYVVKSVDNTSVFLGILRRTAAFEAVNNHSLDADGNMGYPGKVDVTANNIGTSPAPGMSVATVLIKGEIWVPIDENVTQGAPAYIHIAGTGVNKDVFRMTADGANTLAIPAVFSTSGTAGDKAGLYLNYPG